MSQTDFFELPVGDQHRECIEVETDYDRGVIDERKRWENKTCETCKFYDKQVDYCNTYDAIILGVASQWGCIDHEPKGSE